MGVKRSLPGDRSLTFRGVVGRTYDAGSFPKRDYLIDSSRYASEGNWAFCRFENDEVYAARLGFELGSFNITEKELPMDRDLLQLHLELMTRDGAVLWLPTGAYDGAALESDPEKMEIRLANEGKEIFSISGWPRMKWHFQSEEGDVEADLDFTLQNVTMLPDCILPHCVFSMWETMSDVEGFVRFQDRKTDVRGKVFYDHPRIINKRNTVTPRHLYLYTTLYFEDGSGIFGYHAEDKSGEPLSYYCFGIHIDPQNRGKFLADAQLLEMKVDGNNIPVSWRLCWADGDYRIDVEVKVLPTTLLKSWGSSLAPKSLKDFVILPLVLEATAVFQTGEKQSTQKGYGLAEYFNIDYWEI